MNRVKVSLWAVTAFALATAGASAAVISDGSIFADEFNGTSLDTSKWTEDGTTGNPHAFAEVVGGYLGLESRFTELDKTIRSSTLNFGSATEWAIEMKFRVLSDLAPPLSTENRESIILAGMNSGLGAEDFYIAAVEGGSSGTFSLGWGGWLSPISRVPLSAATTDLARNTDYTLVLHHRTDDEIDFYLDGALATTRSAFPGVADALYLGDWSGSTTLRMQSDYIRVGNPVPEPTCLVLAGLGVLLVMRRRMS